MAAVHLDARILRGGRAAQEEGFFSFAEDEQVGDAVLEALPGERSGGGQAEETGGEHGAHGALGRECSQAYADG